MKKCTLFVVIFLIAQLLNAQAPYASYPLDGNANDVSGNNLNGTISGTPAATTNRFNQAGKAMLFNGTTDYIDLPSDFDFPNRTLIAWFYAINIGSANNLNMIYTSDHPNIKYGSTGSGLVSSGSEIFIGVGVGQIGYRSYFNLNTWYQVAIVRTPTVAKCYLNGVHVYTGQNPDTTHANNTISYTAVVGADRGYLAKFFGRIDDIKIYNVALTDSAIFADYNSGGTYKLNDTIHITITDTSHVSISVTDTLFIDANLTGINAPNNTNQLKVFPNPAKDHIYIDNGNYANMTGYFIKISNSLAQDVFSSPINKQQFYIDLNTWSGPGSYFIYILDSYLHIISTKTIIIQ